MNKSVIFGIGGIITGSIIGFGVSRVSQLGGIGAINSEPPVGCDANLHASMEGPLLSVGNETISGSQLPEDVRAELFELTSQNYLRARELIESYGARYAMAKEKGGSVAPAKVPPLSELLSDKKVTDEDVKKFYEVNKKSFPPNMSFASIEKNLRIHLETQRNQEGIRKTMTQLKEKKAFSLLVPSPCGPRVAMDFSKYPSRGNSSAKEHFVAVGDFFCASCRYFKNDVENFLDKHRESIKYSQIIVTEDVNAPIAQLSGGAYCAKKQSSDAFFKFVDRAYNTPYYLLQKNASANEVRDQAIKIAGEAGLDAKSFEKCMKNQEGIEELKEVSQSLKAAGIEKTPVYIASGRRLVTPSQPAILNDLLAQSFPTAVKKAQSDHTAKEKAPAAQ